MHEVRVAITVPRIHTTLMREIEEIVGRGRIFQQGTDERFFVDFLGRSAADLVVINLNQLPGVHATIL